MALVAIPVPVAVAAILVVLVSFPACIRSELINVVDRKPVSVEPPDATCGHDITRPTVVTFNYQRITCTTECPRPYTKPPEPQYSYADVHLRLGYPNCSQEITTNSGGGGASGASGARQEVLRRRKRHNGHLGHHRARRQQEFQPATNGCYFKDGALVDVYNYETYVMRIKPDPSQHNMYLLARDDFWIKLEYNETSQGFHMRFGADLQIYTEDPGRLFVVSLPADTWSHLAIMMNRLYDQYGVSVLVNGEYIRPSFRFGRPIPSRKKRSPVQLDSQRLTIGMNLQEFLPRVGCEENRMETCLKAGYDFVTSSDNDQLQIERSVLGLLIECERSSSSLLPLFGCSLHTKTCDFEPRQPCRELCEAASKECPAVVEDFMRQYTNYTCASLLSQADSESCIGVNYMPSVAPFRGEMKDFRIFNTVLTEREIQQDFQRSASLPADGVEFPECLCNYTEPLLPTDTPQMRALQCASQPVYSMYPTLLGERYRIGELSLGFSRPEYIVLGEREVGWMSSGQQDTVSLVIDLQGTAQIFYVEMELGNMMPPEILLEVDRDGDWELMQLISNRCDEKYPEFPTSATSVICTREPEIEQFMRASFNLLFNRPGWEAPEDNGDGYEYGDYPEYPGQDFPNKELLPRNVLEPVSIEPDLETFLTVKRLKVTFQRLSEGGFKPFSVSKFRALGWPARSCNCHPDGSVEGEKCEEKTGQCPCRTQAQGNIQPSNKRCKPYVGDVFPTKGPVSGGTDIFIWGGFFGKGNITVQLGESGFYLKVIASNETLIQCRTPLLNRSEDLEQFLNQPTPLLITLGSGAHIATNNSRSQWFTYKPDPVISKITPLHSFLLGGIQQTVIGQHLDSVAVPLMSVTLIYLDYVKENGPTVCTVKNSTMMTCPSPTIELPAEVAGPGRRKREVQQPTALDYEGNTVQEVNKRERRQSSGRYLTGEINRDYRQFYIGFKLDGVPTYKNVSEALPGYGIMHIFENPEVFEFDPSIVPYKPFKGEEILTIKGRHLAYGCELQDYTVTVGTGQVCENAPPLFDNQLTCFPPADEPFDKFAKDGAPRVVVEVGNYKVAVGYLQYYNSNWEVPSVRTATIAGVIVLVALIIIIVLFVVWYKKLRDKFPLPERIATIMGIQRGRPNTYTGVSLAQLPLIERLPDNLRRNIEDCMVNEERMTIERQVGSGHFGTVHVGTLAAAHDPTQLDIVAIKTVKDNVDDARELAEFLNEGMIMKDFDHKNVLGLIGVVIRDDRPYVLLPYMDEGDLKKYVANTDNAFTCRSLIELTHQVVKGMTYLASRKFVHRDLAARNCMVNSDRLVKIADFGLARDIYEKDYYRTGEQARPLPVKWMALESIETQTFNSKSDVWACGVTMWEVISRGVKPYADVDNTHLKRYLRQGRRLEKPEFCPDKFYTIMYSCWNAKPALRPTFAQLEREIDALLNLVRSSQGASQEDYDDIVVNVDVPVNEDMKDYLVLVPHPYQKFEHTDNDATDTPNSSQELLNGRQHPLDLGYDKVKQAAESPRHLDSDNIEVLKPVGNAAFNNNDPLAMKYSKNGKDTEPGKSDDGYLAPQHQQQSDGDSEHFDDNPVYLHDDNLGAEVKVTPQQRENVPSEGYMPMNKNSPKPSPKPPRMEARTSPSVKPKPSPRALRKAGTASPKHSPQQSPKPRLKPSPKPVDIDRPVPKPKPKPKAKPSDLDSAVPTREALEEYLAKDKVWGVGEAPTEAYLDMASAPKRDSDGYLAPKDTKDDDYLAPVKATADTKDDDYMTPVKSSTGALDDDYMVPVPNASDSDYTRPIKVTNASDDTDPDYDSRKSFA